MQERQRVRVGPVQVIQGQQQRLAGSRPADAAQGGIKQGGRRQVSGATGVSQLALIAQYLRDHAVRQGCLDGIAAGDPDIEPAPGQGHSRLQHAGFAQPGRSHHENGAAAVRERGIQHPLYGSHGCLALMQADVHRPILTRPGVSPATTRSAPIAPAAPIQGSPDAVAGARHPREQQVQGSPGRHDDRGMVAQPGWSHDKPKDICSGPRLMARRLELGRRA